MLVSVLALLVSTGQALGRWLSAFPWEAGGDRMLRLL